MNKMTNRVIKVSVILMVLLSLFLSWKIWTKPASRSLANKTDKNISELAQTKKITDVYVPTKLFYHSSDDQFWYTNKEKTVLNVNNKLSTFNMNFDSEMNEKEVQEVVYGEDTVSLTFPEAIPFAFYDDIYELHLEIPNKMTDFKINRIVFSLTNNQIYFININDNKGLAYGTNDEMSGIKKLLMDEDRENYTAVSMTPENVGNIYYLNEEMKLKTYSYIVATQSFTTFTKAFFNQSTDLYSNDSDNVNLSNKEGESLTIQADTGEVNYFGKLQKNNNDNNTYLDSYQYVENLGNTMGTLRFFNVKDSEIVFRNYIEGFPVFGNDMKGCLDVSIQNNTVFVKANQENIQIPIPSDEMVTLIKTQDLMDQLSENNADMSLISDAQIGYQWQMNSETKQAVDLVPTWYVKYDSTWYSLNDLLDKLNQGGTN